VQHGILGALPGQLLALVDVGVGPQTIEVVDVEVVGLLEYVVGFVVFFPSGRIGRGVCLVLVLLGGGEGRDGDGDGARSLPLMAGHERGQ